MIFNMHLNILDFFLESFENCDFVVSPEKEMIWLEQLLLQSPSFVCVCVQIQSRSILSYSMRFFLANPLIWLQSIIAVLDSTPRLNMVVNPETLLCLVIWWTKWKKLKLLFILWICYIQKVFKKMLPLYRCNFASLLTEFCTFTNTTIAINETDFTAQWTSYFYNVFILLDIVKGFASMQNSMIL